MRKYCNEHITSTSAMDLTPYEQTIRGIYGGLCVLSIIGLLAVAISIYTNDKLKGHPSPLIANICIVEALLCWNSLMRQLQPRYIICYARMYQSWYNTVFKIFTPYESFLILIWSNEIIYNTL